MLKSFFSVVGVYIGTLIIIGVLVLVGLGFTMVFGPMFNQVDYNNYNSSPQHVQAIVQMASNDCEQLASAKDTQDRLAIERHIYSITNTIDIDKAQMPDDVRSCINSARSDVTK
jgi:hypothetical protein